MNPKNDHFVDAFPLWQKLALFQLYLCKHCRHSGCPANRARVSD